jgi:hypothetical protein
MATATPASPVAPSVMPVMYRSAVMISREAHKTLKMKPTREPLAFARGFHIVPALVEEFVHAARELPVVFAEEAQAIVPVFVLGLKQGQNSFVSKEGLWSASYIPAYIRRYPYILGDVQGQDPVLCMDETFEGFNEKEGDALFDPNGQPSPSLSAAMQFAQDFRLAALKTDAFMQKIRQLDLLKTVALDVKSPKHGQVKLDSVVIIDEVKLKGLPDAEIIALHRSGYLPAIYAHLLSLAVVPNLA